MLELNKKDHSEVVRVKREHGDAVDIQVGGTTVTFVTRTQDALDHVLWLCTERDDLPYSIDTVENGTKVSFTYTRGNYRG